MTNNTEEAVHDICSLRENSMADNEEFRQRVSAELYAAYSRGRSRGRIEGKGKMRHQLRTANRHLRNAERQLKIYYRTLFEMREDHHRIKRMIIGDPVPTPPVPRTEPITHRVICKPLDPL